MKTPVTSALASRRPLPDNLAYDQAMLVLRQTQDGEALAPRDLRLVELVVNFGVGALSADGQSRWDEVVRMASHSAYVRPWPHGVEHLTRGVGGYVYWRNREVEHYSFRDPDAERQAAVTLGACCRRLEALGRQVCPREIWAVHEESRLGIGNSAAVRWLVQWHTGRAAYHVDVQQLPASSLRELQQDKLAALECAMRGWGCDRADVRQAVVASREDLNGAISQLTQSVDWARRALSWTTYSSSEPLDTLLGAVHARISVDMLPTQAELMASYFQELAPATRERAVERG